MRTVKMTGTDMTVSQLALGTAQFGSGLAKEQVFEQLDAYVDLGGNLIDAAHAYGNWEPGSDSPCEELIGEWLKESGKRDQVYVSTKGGHPTMADMNAKRVDIPDLEMDLTASLEKLRVDYVDMYFLHRDDPGVPVEELLGWLEDKVKEGKIRYYGCSNWTLSRIKEAQDAAKKHGWHGFACNQEMGCLADVHPETLPPSNVVMDGPMRAWHEETQLTFMAYMALARGYFVKRLNDQPISEESQANYTAPSNEKIVAKLKELTGGEYSVLDFCYQYLVQQKFPCIPTAGFSGIAQMKEAVESIDKDMPADLLAQVADLKELQK